MTNEQAIKELQESHDIMRNHDIDESESYLMQALNMAIKALQAQADGEKTCGTCRNEDTYHCAECENKSDYEQSQADGEYILKQAVIEQVKDWMNTELRDKTNALHYLEKRLNGLSSVAIPPDHDGCKDCKYETYPEYYYPCCECKQNYTDEWQKKPHWIMKHRTINEVKYHTGLDDMGEEHTIKELIRYEVDEPYCSECGMKAGDTSQNYCCFCGVKMD